MVAKIAAPMAAITGRRASVSLLGLASSRSRKPVSRLPARKSGSLQDAAEQRDVGLDAADEVFVQSAQQAVDRLVAVLTVADQLGQQRIVFDGHVPAFIHAAVAPDARARGRDQPRDLSRRREEIVVGILGVDAALDGMAAQP